MSKIAADLSKYATNKLARLTRKIGQQVLGRSYLRDESPDHPELYSHVRRIVTIRKSLERLKDHHIINGNTEIKEVEDGYLGNILTLDMLLEALQCIPSTKPTVSSSVSISRPQVPQQVTRD